MSQSSERKDPFLSFKKLICNLLLNVHPICTNKWSHPLTMLLIHKYYLNVQTVYSEYKLVKYKCKLENINY